MVVLISFARKSPLLYGPKGRPKAVSEKEISELEVRIKLGKGDAVLEDMVKLIQLYRKSNRFEDAQRYCRQAVSIGEGVGGTENPALIPVLREYTLVLIGMRRKVEADKIRERADKLCDQQKSK